jgi:hypothetical protein
VKFSIKHGSARFDAQAKAMQVSDLERRLIASIWTITFVWRWQLFRSPF